MERLHDLTESMRRLEARREFANYCRIIAKRVIDPMAVQTDLQRATSRIKSAVNASSTTWNDEQQSLTREFLSLLSSRTIVGRIPFRRADPHTRTIKEVASGTATWIDEGVGIPVSQASLDALTLTGMPKIGGLCVFTKESVQTSTPAALDGIERAMLATVGRYSDEAMVNPDIAASGTSPASLTNGATQVVSTGSTEALITANLKSLLQVHANAGSDLQDVYFVMHPTTALHLSQLLTAGNVRAFENLGVRGGDIFQVPVITTVGAVCSGSPSERVVAAINAQGCMVAEGGIEITASNRATIQMDSQPSQDASTGTGSSVVSLFQVESTAIKFIRGLNFARTSATAVSYMKVSY